MSRKPGPARKAPLPPGASPRFSRASTPPDPVQAFLGLCAPHLRPAFNLALLLTGDPAVAADLCEEAVARAYRLDAPFRPLILRSVIDTWRREGPTCEARSPAAAPAPLAALGRLPAVPRAALWLHDCLGLSDEETAYVCRLPVAAVQTELSQARAACRKGL